MNIPALGEHSLRREVASSPYTTDAKIQVYIATIFFIATLPVLVTYM